MGWQANLMRVRHRTFSALLMRPVAISRLTFFFLFCAVPCTRTSRLPFSSCRYTSRAFELTRTRRAKKLASTKKRCAASSREPPLPWSRIPSMCSTRGSRLHPSLELLPQQPQPPWVVCSSMWWPLRALEPFSLDSFHVQQYLDWAQVFSGAATATPVEYWASRISHVSFCTENVFL